jgi:dTDP-4-dehydrorhamnose reductase
LRVGVTGADGLLGTTLVPLWRRAGADVIAWTLADFDLRNADATRRAVVAARPDVVLHAAAYTAVDRAESEPDVAMAVNRDGSANLCRPCREVGARVVFVSTDYVFDGTARSPIPPDARTAPLGAYGRSKAEGERVVAASGCPWMIVRSQWAFGPGGANFVDTVRRAALERRPLRVVDDQVGSPTSTRLLSEGLWELTRSGASGYWHLAAAGVASWFQVARAVFAAADADPALVSPCSTAQAGRAAPRPAYAVLDCAATAAALGVALPPWTEHVITYVRQGRTPGIGLLPEDA